MKIGDSEGMLLTKEEEKLFAESLRRVLIHDNPNPERVGCPDPGVIRDLAFHKKKCDPETFERITDHIFKCSPCAQDALVYAEEYKHELKRRHTRLTSIGIAAIVLLSLVAWQFARLQHESPTVAKSLAPAYSAPPSSVAEVPAGKNNERGVPNVTPIAIELPLSWRGSSNASDHPIILPRGQLQLEIRLPIGSPEGVYQLRISDKSDGVKKTIEATTRSADGIARLQVTLDTSGLSAGNYRLNVLEPGADEWVDHLLTVK